MASSESGTPSFAAQEEIDSFGKHLYKSRRILVLCGAGLSAASGIPTYRGSGSESLWRGHKASSLSCIEIFTVNLSLVWQYSADRRRIALHAKPNEGHEALAKLVKKKKDFVCLTQNIDGLSQRAGHPGERFYQLHGSLMDIKCTNPACDYIEKENLRDPICPALASDLEVSSPPTMQAASSKLSSPSVDDEKTPSRTQYERPPNPLQEILDNLASTITDEMRKELFPTSELLYCPKCSSMLRPNLPH